jgi:hypothetical protein
MAEFFDYDPVTGIKSSFEEVDGICTMHREEEVGGLLDRNKIVRNLGLADSDPKSLPKGALWRHYCDIPVTVQLELLNKGIDIHKKDHAKRMFEEINKNYPYLKLTNKIHVPK